MLTPSYNSLIEILNNDPDLDQKITSRYSIVTATAKRARQIVGGEKHAELNLSTNKAVSIAVNEIFHGHVKVVSMGDPSDWEDKIAPLVQNVPIIIDDSFVMAEDVILEKNDSDADDLESPTNEADEDWLDEDDEDFDEDEPESDE